MPPPVRVRKPRLERSQPTPPVSRRNAPCRSRRRRGDLTPETQNWCGDFVPDVIVNAPGIHLVADHYDFGGPASGSWYGVFIDPKQRKEIEREFDRLVDRLHAATAPRGAVS